MNSNESNVTLFIIEHINSFETNMSLGLLIFWISICIILDELALASHNNNIT